MLKLCVLAVLLFTVNGALLGANKCTWGPSYWCENFEQADKCGATAHCQENVWVNKGMLTTLSGSQDDTDVCTYCKDMVADVKNFLESNKTQAYVLRYMSRACEFLGDDFAVQECKKVEQHYFNQFEQCIKNEMDPNAICKLACLCGNKKSQPKKDFEVKPLQPAKSQLSRVSLKSNTLKLRGKDQTLCEACKSFITMVSTEVKDPKNQAAMKTMMMNECKQLGGKLVAECEMLVETMFPEMVKFVEQELTDQICVSLTLCNSTDTALAAQSADAAKTRLRQALRSAVVKNAISQVSTDLKEDACDTCEMIAGYVKIFLTNNATEEEVQQMLENDVCTKLGEFSDMCKTLVEEYVPQLYSLLLKELDPATLCSDLGLCNKTISAVPLVPATRVTKVRARASPTCILCEFVMSKLESMLSKNSTETEIKQALDKVCSVLPSTIASECESFVDQYTDTIVNLIVQDVSPDMVCRTIGLCATGDSQFKKPLKAGSEGCEVCNIALSYLQSLLKKNSTEEEVLHVVEKVCNYLSGDMAQQCNGMIEQYGPAIVKLIADDIKPQAVCTTLGLCQASVKVDGLVHLLKSSGN